MMRRTADGIAEGPGAAATATRKLKVGVSELRQGMYVCELDRPWLDSPFAFQGFPLRTDADIQAVREVCEYVFVDPERSDRPQSPPRAASAAMFGGLSGLVRRKGAATTSSPVSRVRRQPGSWLRRAFSLAWGGGKLPVDVVHSLEVASRSLDGTTTLMHQALHDVRWSGTIDLPAAREAVGTCVEHIARNADAMLLLGSIRARDEYTAQHSLNVSILAMVLGHRLGLPRAKLKDLGLSAMLHDLGKAQTPLEILNKPGRLTPDELRIMRMHSVQGRDILLGCDGVGRAAPDVALNHHERLDGSGYPRGIGQEEISLFSRIVAITDSYDAITSNRVYDEGRTSIEAIKLLRSASGNQYDAHLVSEFVEAIGLFPPGSVVQLNNGCYGIVVRSNLKYEFRPSVLVLKDARQQDIRPYYLDLADVSGKAGTDSQIARMLCADACGIDPHVLKDQDFLRGIVE